MGIALRRHRVELVGEFNVYSQILLQTRNRQRFLICRKGVVCIFSQHLSAGFDRPLPNLIVFCRRSGENHLAALRGSNAIGAGDERIVSSPPSNRGTRAVLVGGVGDLFSFRTGSIVIDFYTLQARRNRVAVGAAAYRDFIEIVCCRWS